jgi:hypothetical protein
MLLGLVEAKFYFPFILVQNTKQKSSNRRDCTFLRVVHIGNTGWLDGWLGGRDNDKD